MLTVAIVASVVISVLFVVTAILSEFLHSAHLALEMQMEENRDLRQQLLFWVHRADRESLTLDSDGKKDEAT